MANWPNELLRWWNKFAVTGEVDSQNPPATAQEAHRLLVEVQLRQMQEVVQELQTNVDALMAESEDALLPVNLRRTLAVCASVGPATWNTSIPPNGPARCSARFASRDAWSGGWRGKWWVMYRAPLIFGVTSGIPLRLGGQAARATLRHAHHPNPHVWVEATA